MLEISVDGDPEIALVEAIGDPRPGIYPISTPIRYLVSADSPTEAD